MYIFYNLTNYCRIRQNGFAEYGVCKVAERTLEEESIEGHTGDMNHSFRHEELILRPVAQNPSSRKCHTSYIHQSPNSLLSDTSSLVILQ